jgi:GxxExxY protein
LRDVQSRASFEGEIVGRYQADLVVNNAVIAELKAAQVLIPEHEAQLLNYLKATEYEIGVLFNFGPGPRYKRMIFENARKRAADSR